MLRHFSCKIFAGKNIRDLSAFFSRVANSGFSYLVIVLCARTLPKPEFSQVLLWSSAISIAVSVIGLGSPVYLSREVAKYAARNEQIKVISFFDSGIRYCIFQALIACIIIWTCKLFYVAGWPPLRSFFYFYIAATVLYSFSIYSSSIAIALREVPRGLILTMIPTIVQFIALLTLWLTKTGNSLTIVSEIIFSGYFLSSAFGVVTLISLRNRCKRHDARVEFVKINSWFIESFTIGIGQVLAATYAQIDILLIGVISNSLDTALYYAASRIAYITIFYFLPVSAISGPRIAYLYAIRDFEHIESEIYSSSKNAFFFSMLIAILLFVFSPKLLLMYGPEFSEGIFLTYIMTIGWLIYVRYGFALTGLTMTGYGNVSTAIQLVACICNVAMNFIFVPRYGIFAAAFVSLFTNAAVGMVASRILFNKTSIDTKIRIKK
jgi:O-antigen/teichoic acid export membrane protein